MQVYRLPGSIIWATSLSLDVACTPVSSQPNLPALESEVLARWAREYSFQQSIDMRDAGTTGQMNLSSMTAHLLRMGCRITVICSPDTSRTQFRYRRCEAVELSVDSVGIVKVWSVAGRKSSASPATLKSARSESTNSMMLAVQVLQFTEEWRLRHRQACWVDFDNDYKTPTDYMESVMWAFKPCGTRA